METKKIVGKIDQLAGEAIITVTNLVVKYHKFLTTEKKTTNIIAIVYISMIILETFFPLGDFMKNTFGFIGTASGFILGCVGFTAIVYALYNAIPQDIKRMLEGENEE